MSPLNLITALRESDDYITDIFTKGSCYRFHLFLKKIFPDAVPLIHKEKNHVVTEIDGILYDITGVVVTGFLNQYLPMNKKDIALAEGWSFYKNNLLRLTDCPACDEPLCYNQDSEDLEVQEQEPGNENQLELF